MYFYTAARLAERRMISLYDSHYSTSKDSPCQITKRNTVQSLSSEHFFCTNRHLMPVITKMRDK